MKKWIIAAVSATLLIGMNGCVQTNDISVENMTNEKANLKAYKTYQFLDESGIVVADKDGKLHHDEDKKAAAMIEEIINTQLQKAGKVPTSKEPDFFVAYVGGTDKHAVETKLDEKGKKIVENIPEAALIILLIDAQTGAVLRISTAEGELKSLTPDDRKVRIEYAVKKMLKDI